MANNLGWIPLDEIINSYLDRSEQSIHKYSKVWHIAHDGMQQLGLDFFFNVRTVNLPVLLNRTVALPSDYLNYIKVGVFNSNGQVIPWKRNNSLTTYSDLSPNRIANTESNSLYSNYDFGGGVYCNYWDGNSFGNLYGTPSGSPYTGSFNIDIESGVILLGNDFSYPSLCMEYVSSPEEGGVYYVPMQFKEALIWFIGWQDIAFLGMTRKGSISDKADRKRNFYNERRLAQARYKPFSFDQAYEEDLQNQRMTVKA